MAKRTDKTKPAEGPAPVPSEDEVVAAPPRRGPKPVAPARGAVREPRPPERREMVPGWLAILVMVLIAAVVGVGGWMLRGSIAGPGERTPQTDDIQKWTQAVQQDPTNIQSRLNLAYAYQQDQQYDVALEGYRAVLKDRPRDTAALYNMGVIYMLTGQAKQGEAALWEVLKVDPTHPLAAKELGEYYAARKHYKSLLVAVEPALQAKPNLADLQYLAGLAYEKLGDTAKAIGHYQQALQYSPDMQKAKDGLTRLGAGTQ